MGPFQKVLIAALLVLWPNHAVAQDRLVVFTPASMGDVMARIGDAFAEQGGTRPVLSIAGTAQLARQVVAGAPADVFISADKRWMDYAVRERAVDAAMVKAIAGNRLVLAVRNEVKNWADAKALTTKARFAMGAPESVPAGTYGRAALEKLGWWEDARSQAVYSENVRIALKWLVRGEVGAALVYASDSKAEPAVKTAFTFAAADHLPIRYFAAPVGEVSPTVRAFLSFLTAAEAQKILTDAGFMALQNAGKQDADNGG